MGFFHIKSSRMPSHKKVLTNALIQFLGKVGTVVASFIVVKIVSGFGKEFYGNYVTAYEFLAFFGILADAGLFAIAVRDISKLPKQSKKAEHILGNILSMRLVLILIATLAAGFIAQLIPSYNEWVKVGIWITGLSMALTIIAGTLSAILQARMKIQYFSGSLVTGKIILAGLITWISFQFGTIKTPETLFFTFLWAGVISNLVFVSLVYAFARLEVSIRLHFDLEYWKKTLTESLPYGIALILQTLYLRADLVLISVLLGSAAVGVYGVSARVLESFLVLGVFFGQAILPKITRHENHQEESNQLLGWGIEKLLIFALPIIWGSYTFAPEIIQLLSSTEYLSTENFFGSDKVLMILVPTVLFAFLNQLFSFTLVAKKKQKYLLYTNALAFGLNLILNIVFLPQYGIIAAAISTVICEIIVLACLTSVMLKYFTPKLNLINCLIIFGLNAGLFLTIWFVPCLKNHLAYAVVFSGILYLSVLYLFRKRFI